MAQREPIRVERVQTGVRMEKRMLKVLRALAEHKDVSLGDLLEGIVLHAFEGRAPFSPETLEVVRRLRAVYDLRLGADGAHRLREAEPKRTGNPRGKRPAGKGR